MDVQVSNPKLIALQDMNIGTVFSKPNHNQFFLKICDYQPKRFQNVFDITNNQLCTIPESEKFQIRNAVLKIE